MSAAWPDDPLRPAPSARRPGLAWSVTVTFLVLAGFSIGLNSIVAWRMNAVVLGGEDARTAREVVRTAALMMRSASDDAGVLLRDMGATAVIAVDAQGRVVSQAGAQPEPLDPRDTGVLGAIRIGSTTVDRRGTLGGPMIRIVAPVASLSAPGGALVVWVRPTGAGDAERARRLSVAYATLNAVVVGFLGWYLVTRSIVRPVRRLSTATRSLAAGDLGVRVRMEGFGELESLARDFNAMTEALQRKLGELEEANRSLRAAREEVIQAEKLASVGRLAAGVAHELGNPVAAVTGYVSMLLRGREEAQDADSDVLRRIDREMKRVDRIIRDLLEYARPREQTETSLDVNGVVEGAIAIVSGQKGFKGIELEKKLEATSPVKGDPHRLSQVLVNLLINAADAVEASPERRIRVETSETEFPTPAEPRRRSGEEPPRGPAVCIRVTDSGSGLSGTARDRVFEPFFTTKQKGTGLGLAISRTIVESMGGLIEAQQAPGGTGASFLVLLPPAGAPRA